MAVTFGSVRTVRKDWLTVADVALPPVSRKFEGRPPRVTSESVVFIARPAPLTFDFVSLGGRYRPRN